MHVSPEFYERLDRYFGGDPVIADSCRAVAAYMEATPREHLRMLSFTTLAQILGKQSVDDEVVRVATLLSTSACHLLTKKWMFLDAETGDEYELGVDEVRACADEGVFAHPESGELVQDAANHIFPFFEPGGLTGG